MNNKRYYLLVFTLLLVFPLLVFGQEAILRLPPYTVSGKYLNQQIADDTVANGKLANRVYVLERGRLYLSNAVFNNNGKWTLRLRANDTISGVNKPVIMLYPTGTGTTPQNPPGNLFALQGDLYLKNLIITGYYEPVDSNLNNLQGALINMPAASPGSSIYIDSCILSNTNGNHIRTDGAPRVIKVTNSIFANMGYLGKSNLGGGKAVDIRDVSCDSLIMVNNTFTNWQDRVIRHYPLTGPTGPLKYFLFDHNTLANGQSYHGLLSLGSMGSRAIITNNLFVDPFSLGNDTDAVRQAEFVPSGEKDPYGGARMTWIFSVPNDTTRWTVANNYYAVSDSGLAFYRDYATAGVTGEGSPLSWHINGKLGADSVNAFKKVTLSLNKTPLVMTKANRWYRWVNGGNKTKNTPTSKWNNSYDYDRKGYVFLRDTLNGTYPTTSAVYTGAEKGFPAGDLNWFPAKKAQWLTSSSAGPGPASVLWNLILPDSANPSTTVGNVTGQPISGSNFYVRSFSGTPNGPLGTTNMRWWPSSDGGVTGSSWGPETGEVANRYIQLQVAPSAGYAFIVDSVSFWSCGGGTSSMRFNAYYSTDAAFATKTRLNADTVNLDNSGNVTATTRYAYKVGTTVPGGKTFYFRIYPWYAGAASTSKYVYTQLAEIKGSTALATAVRDEYLVPKEIQLAQNYPNPFNPSTTLQFSLTKSGQVTLEVFNVLGQRVASVVNETLSAGTYRVNFNASALSSGVYLYRLRAGDFVQTKKMVLMK